MADELDLTEHAARTRAHWNEDAPNWVASGRARWERRSPVWGMWDVPEDDVHILRADGARDVLDLGCGTGTLAVDLARSGAHVIGVDGDEEILGRAAAKARHAGVELDLREGLAGSIPLGDGSVDAVVCSLLWHHLVPADKAAGLIECRRVLRPGGRLLVAVEDGDLDDAVGRWLGVPMFFSHFDAETTTRLAREAGFDVLSAEVETQREGGVDVPYLWLLARKPA